MLIFVTGASGFIGSAVVKELIGAGHQVLGLARSDASAAALAVAGAQAHRGDLNDLESLRSGAAGSDGVIHCGFIHDFSNFAASVETDKRAIEVLGNVLAGSDRPFVVTAGLVGIAQDRLATEDDPPNAHFPRVSEQSAMALARRGVRVSVVRLPPSVHGEADHGFVPALIGVAREKHVSAFIGDGSNQWSAVHRIDAARLFRLALEKAPAGSIFHGVADEGVPTREIAAAIGRQLNVPVLSKSREEADEHFGWIGRFFGMDARASSAKTQQQLGWQPTHPTLLEDLNGSSYFAEVKV